MYNDFIVKVHRYWEDDIGSRIWDGWYFSKVYAIDGNDFLVYDNGEMSAYNGEEDFCETGFNWVDCTATMDRCGDNGRQPIVEPLVPFNIVEYLADRKTEPNGSEKPNNCETCKRYKLTCDLFSEICKYEPKDEPLTADYCDTCDHKECEYCIADSSNPYCVPSNYHKVEDESTISKMEQVEEPQTEDGIMPEVKAGVRFDENNKTLWIKTDTVENYDRVIIEDGSNWCRIFYEECGECAHNKPRSNDEPQTDCAWK